MNQMKNIADFPWAAWLEEQLHAMVEKDVRAIVVVAYHDDGIATGRSEGLTADDLSRGVCALALEAQEAFEETEEDI